MQSVVLTKYKILPFRSERINVNTNIVTGYFGGWCLLTDEELSHLKRNTIEGSNQLKRELLDSAILIDNKNINKAVEIFNGTNRNLFLKPSLHMINTTNTCNYRCRYCHAGVSQGKDMMSEETALKTLEFIFKSSGHAITIEFQGGESLLNWKVVKLVVKKARELNKFLRRDLHICIVTNLGLMDEEKIEFLTNHDVSICSSLDGSKEVHDRNRRSALGKDTHQSTIDKIHMCQEYYKKHDEARKVDLLATITRTALKNPREIIDTYVDLGIKTIHLRSVQNLGDALPRWSDLTYSAEEFYKFWEEAMDYIIELNKKGIDMMERGAFNILSKVLKRKDPLYVELMSPTGCGRTSLLYNHDGSIYSSDEGRMIPEPMFKIGTVNQDPKEVLLSKENISTMTSTLLDLTCYHSPFRPWAGIHPVLIYQNQGTIIPKISHYNTFKIHKLQCKYLFKKIAKGGFELELFNRWADRIIK